MHDRSQRISELKRQRGYFEAFGQHQKVKAVDSELAQLRAGAEERPKRGAKPSAEVETAVADTSNVESAAARRRTKRAAKSD